MRIAVIPNLTRERAQGITVKLCASLRALGIEVNISRTLRQAFPELPDEIFVREEDLIACSDIVMPVGGDGSVIRAAKTAARNGKKILGVNAGSLAYLCGLDSEDFSLLPRLLTGEYTEQRRMLLKAKVYEGETPVAEHLAINDVVFCRGRNVGLIDLSVEAIGKPIADYIADGVIFATPTGSTAYSMSAGGPIVEPTLEAVLVTAVCPHSLAFRPYIFAPDTVFTVRGKNRTQITDICYSCDGEETFELSEKSVITIERSGISAEFISLTSDNFIDVLNKKAL